MSARWRSLGIDQFEWTQIESDGGLALKVAICTVLRAKISLKFSFRLRKTFLDNS